MASRAPPKRTYGKRGARLFKQREKTPEAASDTDVSEDDTPTTTPRASNGGKRPRLAGGDNDDLPQTSSPRTLQAAWGEVSQPDVVVQPPSTACDSDDNTQKTQRTLDVTPRTPPALRRTRAEASVGSPGGQSSPGSPAASQERNGESRQGSVPPRPPRRRMLSRAESMHTTSQPNMPTSAPTTPRALRTAQSMPITPGSAHSHVNANESPGGAGSPTITTLVPVAMGSPSPAGKIKRTYGGNRSFLAQRATDLDTALSEDAQPSYSELRKAYEVDTGDDDSIRNLTEEFNLARAPEPINDMRSKGENRLFMDDIGVLLGDINNSGQSLALRRSSALDVLQKMQEGEWMARLRGHTESVFADLCSARGDDAILGAACLLFLALLAKGVGLRKLLEGEVHNVTAVLRCHIDLTTGPLDQAFKGKVTLSRLRSIASKIFDEQAVGGSRGIASFVLAEACQDSAITPQFQSAVTHEEIDLSLFRQLKEDGMLLKARMELYRKGIDLLPRDGTVDLDAIEQSLRSLSRVVAVSLEREQLSPERECISALLHLLVAMIAVAVDEEEDDYDIKRQAARCVVLSLQVLAPLADPVRMASGTREAFEAAHEDEATFAAFGRLMLQRNRWPELCKSAQAGERTASPTPRQTSATPTRSPLSNDDVDDQSNDVEATELLIFMSPVLDRILPTTRSAAIKVATTSVSGCGTRACIFGCRCLSSISFASLVVSLYNEYSSSTEGEHGRTLLLSMFLTVLLTRLLVTAPTHVRPLVQRELPGDSWRDQLAGLHVRLVHFRSVYATVREQIRATAAGNELGEDGGDTMLDEALMQLQPLIKSADAD